MPPTRSIRSARPPACINTDVLGVLGPARDFTHLAAAGSSACSTCWSTKARSSGRTFTPDPRPEAGGFFRSDHFPFAKVGVPAISFGPGNDLVNGGIARGQALAGRLHREDVSPAGRRMAAQLGFHRHGRRMPSCCTRVGLRLANSCEWPNWSQDSEFRAARDATAAERQGAAPRATAGQAGRARVSAIER